VLLGVRRERGWPDWAHVVEGTLINETSIARMAGRVSGGVSHVLVAGFLVDEVAVAGRT
jgi:hypothetical protein